MGNQNTSGIVEEEKARDNVQGVSPPQHLIQENAVEAESDNKGHLAEILASDDKVTEDNMEGCDGVMDIGTNGSDSMLSHEEQQQPCTLKADQEAENTTLVVDFHEAEKNEDDSVLADMPCIEGDLLEEQARGDDPREEVQINSSNTINNAPTIGFLDSSTSENDQDKEWLPLHNEEKPMLHELDSSKAENEHEHELLALDHEEKPMMHCVDEDQPSDQEINKFLIRCSSDLMDMIKSEFKENGGDRVEDAEKQEEEEEEEEDKPIDQDILEKAVDWESEPSPTDNDHEIETEKCVVEMQSSREIDTHGLSRQRSVAETPPSLPVAQDSDESESTARALDSNPGYVGAKVELKKSPSFDFGISFDTRSEESDQTPLLYQDKTARRSLSSCSNPRFQNRVVQIQTEYVAKPLQLEAVQAEEKTIRMERSNSESLNNKQENANAVMTEIDRQSSKASPSRRDDEAASSPKGRRKPKSSLFTICICCTAAIS